MEFKCSYSGRPKAKNLSWYKNGRKLEESSRFKILYDLSDSYLSKDYSKLVIYDIQREDAAIYQCFVSNSEFGSEQAITRLELGHSPPVLHAKFKSVNVGFAGKSSGEQLVSLKCEFSGNPLPKIQWLLDGQPLFANGQTVGQNIDKTLVKLSERVDTSPPVTRLASELQILIHNRKQSTSLGGLYSCLGSNLLGKVEHFARINVEGVVGVRAMPSRKLISGMPLMLFCPYTGYPIDSIQWFKGEFDLAFFFETLFINKLTLSAIRFIKTACKPKTIGLYERNAHGSQRSKRKRRR